MVRFKKKLCVLIAGALITYIFCEYLIYYVVVAQCSWPELTSSHNKDIDPVKAFILADTHMLGPRRGHWADKWRRELQMHRAFQAIMQLHKPDVVFLLGDVFDEGEWCNKREFNEYVERFQKLFYVPQDVPMYVAVGNHDIGFHNYIRRGSAERFTKMFNAPSVQFITIKDNHFVLINSMAMHGDRCSLCTEARAELDRISKLLKCSEDETKCRPGMERLKYSPPIIMQHFPLYRESDEHCSGPDAAPPPERAKPFRDRVDALSLEASGYLSTALRPRAALGGHTHHGCRVEHTAPRPFVEYSVPSFSWRNRLDPKYMLVTISPEEYSVSKCGLPLERTIIGTAVILMLFTVYCAVKIGRLRVKPEFGNKKEH